MNATTPREPIRLMTGGRKHSKSGRMCMVLVGTDWEVPQDWCQFAATHYVEVVQQHGGVQSTTLTHVCAVHLSEVKALHGFKAARPVAGAS